MIDALSKLSTSYADPPSHWIIELYVICDNVIVFTANCILQTL